MQRLQITIFFVLYSFASFAQDTNIVFEQKALDFFADSIIGKQAPFQKSIVYFKGKVDESISIVRYDLVKKYPEDAELKEQYRIESSANNDFWKNNKKDSFKLKIKSPIQKRKYRPRKKHNVGLMVFQNKQIGNRNHIWFRTFTEDGEQGHDLHFIMNNNGEVLDWIKISFIF